MQLVGLILVAGLIILVVALIVVVSFMIVQLIRLNKKSRRE